MKTPITITIAALITAAGPALAQTAPAFAPAAIVDQASTSAEFTPMTRSERLRTYLTGTFGPGALATSAISAGFSQFRETPSEWGQDREGFGQRFGNAYAKHVIRGTLQYGAATALHEDDRYFASGEKGFFRRVKYAVASTFLARRDNGQRTFAAARFGSAAGAAFISNAWQPPSTSGAGESASRFGFTIASDLGSNVIREFLPDLKRCFRRN